MFKNKVLDMLPWHYYGTHFLVSYYMFLMELYTSLFVHSVQALDDTGKKCRAYHILQEYYLVLVILLMITLRPFKIYFHLLHLFSLLIEVNSKDSCDIACFSSIIKMASLVKEGLECSSNMDRVP